MEKKEMQAWVLQGNLKGIGLLEDLKQMGA
jgi:hypothetical protein